ncbi:MAG: D-alanine--D-alanine ligase family protein [Bryobacter sp.]|nr:D-alanine--D-alanine ligase family protein [Bryobacter sp.]
MKKLRIAVLAGGRSGEHEVSLRSAESIATRLDPDKYEVNIYEISREGIWSPRPILPEPDANPSIDVVFPITHGTFGEDGTMQGLLELADLPYVGPGVLSSALAMDKEFTKRVLRASDVPVVEYRLQYRGALDPDAAIAALGLPLFVKPANLGSSVGIHKAKTREELADALADAAQYDTKILIERAIVGREFECSVLGNIGLDEQDLTASLPCEILPAGEFYDYDAKYVLDTTRIDLPAQLRSEETTEVQTLAVAACRALGCEGMSRVDFLQDSTNGKFYVNEVNTLPGFTSISMYPKMWEHSGIGYSELLDRLIQLALARHQRKLQTKFTR